MKIHFLCVLALLATPAVAQEIRSPLPGKYQIQFIAPAGKQVRRGEIVCVLDPKSHLDALQASRDSQAKFEAEILWLESDTLEQRGKEERALLDLRAAQAQGDRYQLLDQPAKEKTLAQAVTDAEWNMRLQKDRFDNRDKMLSEGFIRQVEFDEIAVMYQRTQTLLSAAVAALEGHRKYEKAIQLDANVREVKQKSAVLAKVKDTTAAALAKNEKALENIKNQLAGLQKDAAGIKNAWPPQP